MPGFRIWQGCEYARVTQVPEYAWISLNILQYASISMCFITLSMLENACIQLNKQSLNMPEFFNVSDAVHECASQRWVCLKLPANSWINRVLNMPEFFNESDAKQHKITVNITEQLSRKRCLQNTVKHLRWNALQKE